MKENFKYFYVDNTQALEEVEKLENDGKYSLLSVTGTDFPYLFKFISHEKLQEIQRQRQVKTTLTGK